MTAGTLFLVPNLLGLVRPEDVLPARTIAIARSLDTWIVESPKPARAFLKSLAVERPVAELSITAIGDASDASAAGALLAPVLAGQDAGLLSDAGCPGIADPGAGVIAAAHDRGIRVVPLVGPSSPLLALMAAGMNGQRFAFHGYLPTKPGERAAALRQLEAESRARRCTQIFIETPYRNPAMLATIADALAPATRLCVAVDLTLSTESVTTKRVVEWRGQDFNRYARRPAIFLIEA